jgi:hypothetical protein
MNKESRKAGRNGVDKAAIFSYLPAFLIVLVPLNDGSPHPSRFLAGGWRFLFGASEIPA